MGSCDLHVCVCASPTPLNMDPGLPSTPTHTPDVPNTVLRESGDTGNHRAGSSCDSRPNGTLSPLERIRGLTGISAVFLNVERVSPSTKVLEVMLCCPPSAEALLCLSHKGQRTQGLGSVMCPSLEVPACAPHHALSFPRKSWRPCGACGCSIGSPWSCTFSAATHGPGRRGSRWHWRSSPF